MIATRTLVGTVGDGQDWVSRRPRGYYGVVPDVPQHLPAYDAGAARAGGQPRGPAFQESTVQIMDLDETVRGAVVRLLDVPPDQLTVQTPLRDIGLDEESGLAVLVVVEDALDVRFPDDFLEGLHTYGDLTSAVRRAVGG
jgi:acyl carrier protein